MTPLALVLIVLSALLHASWNLVLKKSGGGPAFTWLFSVISLVLYAPAALLSFPGRGFFSPWVAGIVVVSALCETGYYLALQAAYHGEDLSVVYPIARGTGPLLSVLLAGLLLGEELGVDVLAGTVLVIGGSLFLALRKNSPGNFLHAGGIVLGVLSGVFISGYTLVDKAAMSLFRLPPFFYFWVVLLLQVLFLAPVAASRTNELLKAWSFLRKEAFVIGALCPMAYLVVLWALSFTPVSRVAPCREVGIVFGTFLGARFLGEKGFRGRLAASAAVFLGIFLLAAR